MREVMNSTIRITAMIFFIFIVAQIFALAFRGLRGEGLVYTLFGALPGGFKMGPVSTMLLLFILGFFLEWIEIYYIVLPLFFPYFANLGVDPVWLAIFVAIIFGQVEAGLANPYGASRDILNYHSTIGWSLAGVLALLTGWRYVARQKDPTVLPKGFLAIDFVLAGLVFAQVYLGDKLVWIYGLHTVPVVDAIRKGVLS